MTLDELRASSAATVTIKAAAEIVGVSERTLTGELSIHGGTIQARRVGRRVVLPRDSFISWIDGDNAVASPVADEVATTSPAAVVRAKLLELLAALEEV